MCVVHSTCGDRGRAELFPFGMLPTAALDIYSTEYFLLEKYQIDVNNVKFPSLSSCRALHSLPNNLHVPYSHYPILRPNILLDRRISLTAHPCWAASLVAAVGGVKIDARTA